MLCPAQVGCLSLEVAGDTNLYCIQMDCLRDSALCAVRSHAGTAADDASSASGMSTMTNDDYEPVQLLGQPGREQEVDSDFERELALLVGGPLAPGGPVGLPAGHPEPTADQTNSQKEDGATVDFKVMLRKGAKPRSVQVRYSAGASVLALSIYCASNCRHLTRLPMRSLGV
jgi:hypothetical protein